MTIQRCGLAVLVFALALAGCAPAMSPVRTPGQRMEIHGFSIMSPGVRSVASP
jgi:hypothetical protein